jgi:glutamate dehydrogenase (NAD(P)+)
MTELPAISRDRILENETFPLIVTTVHEDAVATTAIHGRYFDRHIGGARFVEGRDGAPADALLEVVHLASAMTQKCAAASIPADGQKTVITTSLEVIGSEERRAAILSEHASVVSELDPSVIFGPDMNNPESVQDIAAQAGDLLDHFTGLSATARGLSIDSKGYTAHGLVQGIRACVGDAALAKKRVSIQGFGAVGAHTARLLHERGAKIVAVSNRDSLIVGEAIDVPGLFEAWRQHGDLGLQLYARDHGLSISSSPNDLFDVPTDILVPAARTAVLGCRAELEHIRTTENLDVRSVEDFFASTGVELIAEGANHPLSISAESWLEARGVRVLPDFIVNCGGLIGCWIEWEARHRYGLSPEVDLNQIGDSALARISDTVTRNVQELLRAGSSARNAAAEIVERNRALLLSMRH